mmetsp:Transcript_13805/g.23448  ORF Transcript_13805/g.23448 Transcript_13805/m.23448 type:complete len:304 (-) Transcript_13805:65-976(-)
MKTSKDDDKKQPPAAEDTGKSSPMDGLVAVAAAAAAIGDNKDDDAGNNKKKRKQSNGRQRDGAQISAARARRLEQNRRAAIESRRRKKVMIGELQRSVTFYSKANENLKKSNEELEALLLIAKQKLSQKDGGDHAVATAGGLKTPEEEESGVVESSPSVDAKVEQQPAPVTVPTPLASVVDPANVVHADQAHFSAMQAVYENMGYPSAAARSAASVYSQFDTGFNDAKKPDPVPAVAAVDSDTYIQSLEQYALQKTAAANAATLAANQALRIANWHKMMKSSGQNASTSDEKPSPVPSVKEEK